MNREMAEELYQERVAILMEGAGRSEVEAKVAAGLMHIGIRCKCGEQLTYDEARQHGDICESCFRRLRVVRNAL